MYISKCKTNKQTATRTLTNDSFRNTGIANCRTKPQIREVIIFRRLKLKTEFGMGP